MKRPPNAGRKKGAANKLTTTVKAALTEAFDKKGGVPALLAWAEQEPTAFYGLWGRMLPQEHDITSNGQTLEALVASSKR